MAGIVNDNIVFPVLDLIRDEISRVLIQRDSGGVNPLEGTPSVKLFRDHPFDLERVTGVELYYESRYVMDIYLNFGSDDVSTYPDGVDSTHPDYDYYLNGRLTSVTTSLLDPAGNPIAELNIGLHYDTKGLLTETVLTRI